MTDKKLIFIVLGIIILVAVLIIVLVTKNALIGLCGCAVLVLWLLISMIRMPKHKTDVVFLLSMAALMSAGAGTSLFLHIRGNDLKGNMTFISVIGGLAAVVFTAVVSNILRKKRCNHPVEAVCSDLDVFESSNSDNNGVTRVYAPVWEYVYEGAYYNESEKIHSKNCRVRKGTKMTLYIDPNAPEDFIGVNYTSLIKIVVVLCVLTGAAICIFYNDIFR